MRRKLRAISGGKMTEEERQAKLALLRSQARDLDCLRNEMSRIKPGEACDFSEASLRALMMIKRKFEREYIDD